MPSLKKARKQLSWKKRARIAEQQLKTIMKSLSQG